MSVLRRSLDVNYNHWEISGLFGARRYLSVKVIEGPLGFAIFLLITEDSEFRQVIAPVQY